MDPSLQERLRKEIEKSGFPLELDVVERMRTKSWLVHSNVRYPHEESRVLEIDVIASLSSDDTSTFQTGIDLIIECKTSRQKPWVFFSEPFDPLSIYGCVESAHFVTDLQLQHDTPFIIGCYNSALAQHHYGHTIPTSRTYFEAFGKDAGIEIFRGIQSIWSGVDWWADLLQSRWSRLPQSKNRVRGIHGVLVFDGVLTLASKTESGFHIREVPHIVLRTSRPWNGNWTRTGISSELLIDVVRPDYIETYADMCEQDLLAIHAHVETLKSGGYMQERSDK